MCGQRAFTKCSVFCIGFGLVHQMFSFLILLYFQIMLILCLFCSFCIFHSSSSFPLCFNPPPFFHMTGKSQITSGTNQLLLYLPSVSLARKSSKLTLHLILITCDGCEVAQSKKITEGFCLGCQHTCCSMLSKELVRLSWFQLKRN